ncbi:alpha/beta-hydrolase [Trichodelitschia bisporula]|uniref:Alpha/beta-hydrolase n=1 Tax=Trichodelitschia bisporula TaxID=703511 RepID=A0A6G1HQ88_9PEZI|nr:alpha/beta-hydrolase [Trichodelitschia bisporula]
MIPFLGRLHPWEYLSLLVSFILIGLESFIRIITLCLPAPIINFCYRTSRRLFNYLSSPTSRKSRKKKRAIVTSIAQASDFVELCELFDYYAEEHIVQTKDGYLLGLHRLGWKKGEEDHRVNSGKGSIKKKVVYLHHGLMMNSEVWVCLTERERCLPFVLVEQGYDVWLGNNRGNKYSKKSTLCAPTETRFWNFSIDQFAFHDIPDSVDYILATTGQPSLSYIGFSQGTAQAFAALSIHPTLNEKVNLFIALAPAMSPSGLTSGIVDSFIKSSPDVLFLAFGRRAILGSATMWQAILYPPIFVRTIDMSLGFLFGWKTKNITPHQKLAAYPHLYSFTSTKSVVHWFQIIRNGKFQMYDDEVQGPFKGERYYKVAKFPTRNIKTPIVMVYGGRDSLVDINVMLKELPKHTTAQEVPHYEHLDFLWADDVATRVFPIVFEALEQYAQGGEAETSWDDLRAEGRTDSWGARGGRSGSTHGHLVNGTSGQSSNHSSPGISDNTLPEHGTEGWSSSYSGQSEGVDCDAANGGAKRRAAANSFSQIGGRGIRLAAVQPVGGVVDGKAEAEKLSGGEGKQ